MKNLLKNFIKHVIQESSPKIVGHRGYYSIDPNDPPTIEDIKDAWAKDGLKPYDEDSYHAYFSPEELWRYREYDWSAKTAEGEEVISTSGNKFSDKWNFVPDENENVGLNKWNAMVEKMKSGWKTRDPAHVEIGKNGVVKVGEGNHRLAIAKELGIKVPVMFHFRSNVELSSASNVR
jgi:hypothetical protein